MRKPDIKRLKYPLWFRLTFLCLTTVLPLVLLMVEGYKSPSTGFKITFGIITSILIVWVFVNHFIVKPFANKVLERQTKLEHDYEIDVGNATKIKWIWFSNELILTAFNAISVLLYGSLVAIILEAVADKLMQIKGLIVIVVICYLIAFVLKFLVIWTLRGKEDETD